jgi:Spy/CpxP family protein refolding chaperone
VKRIATMTAVALAVATGAWAQGAPRSGAGRPARDELFKMIDAYIVSNLQESLSLTDEQFVKLLPLVKKRQATRRDFAQRRREAIGEMRRLLESGTATELRIGDLLKALKAQEVDEPLALRRDADAVDAVLSPLQQAKLRILEARVEQRLRELAKKSVGQGAGGRPQRDAPGSLDTELP